MDLAPLALVALGAGLGFCLIGGGIGFAGPYRRLLEAGNADGVRAQLVFLGAGIALHALAFGPGGFSGGFVAPAGLAVVVGAFVFGIGMQMANGCGSGTLAALGAGSLRMRAVLPTFVAGAFAGSLAAPFWSDLPAFAAVSLGEIWGWGPAAFFQLVLVAAIWFALPGARRVSARPATAALALAGLSVLCLPLAGHPWGITSAFALGGAKIAQTVGWDASGSVEWSQGWMAEALAAPLWQDTTFRLDLGLVLGAFAAARWTSPRPNFEKPDARGWMLAAVGGLLMGYGARISGGCNIGAFIGGVVSGSPHGWLWIAAALAGSRVGITLTPSRRS